MINHKMKKRKNTMSNNRYRKKPVIIEAMQYRGHHPQVKDDKIQTLEGVFEVKKGDWIIKGVKGEYYPCKPDIFAQTYEKVGDTDD